MIYTERERLTCLIKAGGLKITPQRMTVLETLANTDKHPSADHIIGIVRKKNPGIAIGTIYKILEVFAERGIISRVYSEKDILRYDADISQHHHLCSDSSGRIEDYRDDDLNRILNDYFRNRDIPNFSIEDIRVQIKGRFKE